MTVINCSVGDSTIPKGELPVLRLGSPFSFEIPNGETFIVKTGVSFDVPVVLYKFDGMSQGFVNLVNAGSLVPPGQTIVAVLESTAQKTEPDRTAMFEVGDSLLYVVPLVSPDARLYFVP